MSGLPRERTPGEKVAYLEGFEASLKLFEDRLKQHTSGDGSAIRAAAAEVRAIGAVVRDTMKTEVS